MFSICGEARYIYLLVWGGVLFRVKFHGMKLKVLGIPHLHGESFQKVEPLISAKDYVPGHR